MCTRQRTAGLAGGALPRPIWRRPGEYAGLARIRVLFGGHVRRLDRRSHLCAALNVWHYTPVEDETGQDRHSPFVKGLERGLSVIRVFSAQHDALTVADVARLTGFTRATARRSLLTLQRLGYVAGDGRQFRLTARVLDLGYAYLSSGQISEIAEPEMVALSELTTESVSAAVLDGLEVVYIARAPTKRLLGVTLSVGSRRPAPPTSMGRVLLADKPEEELRALFADAELVRHTKRTIVNLDELLTELAAVRRRGWALVDQEIEEGVRSIAAPIRDHNNRVVAAMNVVTNSGRVTIKQLTEEFLPALQDATAAVSDRLRARR
jgi:IclR family pca regulon transcriptional regulator